MELKIELSDEAVRKAGQAALLYGIQISDLKCEAERGIDAFLSSALAPPAEDKKKPKRTRKAKPADPNAPAREKAPYGSKTVKKINDLCETLHLTIEKATSAARVQVVDNLDDLNKNQKAALLNYLQSITR